jgi:hypothetical protein
LGKSWTRPTRSPRSSSSSSDPSCCHSASRTSPARDRRNSRGWRRPEPEIARRRGDNNEVQPNGGCDLLPLTRFATQHRKRGSNAVPAPHQGSPAPVAASGADPASVRAVSEVRCIACRECLAFRPTPDIECLLGVGTASSRGKAAVVVAARSSRGNPGSAVPRIAASRASAGGLTERRLEGAHREYALRRRPAPHAAMQVLTGADLLPRSGRSWR